MPLKIKYQTLAVIVANLDIPLDTSNCHCYCCFSYSTVLLGNISSLDTLSFSVLSWQTKLILMSKNRTAKLTCCHLQITEVIKN